MCSRCETVSNKLNIEGVTVILQGLGVRGRSGKLPSSTHVVDDAYLPIGCKTALTLEDREGELTQPIFRTAQAQEIVGA